MMFNWKNLTIKTKTFFVFIIVFLTAAAGLSAMFLMRAGYTADSAMAGEVLGGLRARSESVEGSFYRLLLAEKDYLNGDTAAAEDIKAEVKQLSGDLESLTGATLPESVKPYATALKEAVEKHITLAGRLADTGNHNLVTSSQGTQSVETALSALKAFDSAVNDGIHDTYLSMNAAVYNGSFAAMVILGVTMLLVLGVYLYMIFDIIKPVNRLLRVSDAIASGVTEVDIRHIDKGDEITALNNSFLNVWQNLHDYIEAMQAVADKDLTAGITVQSSKDAVAGSMRKMLEENSRTLSRIRVAADHIDEGATAMLKAGASLSKASIEQSGAVDQITATVAEISIQARQNASSAKDAESLALNIAEYAGASDKQMKEMVLAMGGINDSAANIYNITKAIEQIAFQTNILSINAAVEAAKAGESGRGFAVVAGEVRNLAERSAKAVLETHDLIEEALEKVGTGSKIASETASSLAHISELVDQNTRLVKAITIASDEQSIGLSQVSEAIVKLADIAVKNSGLSEESAMASEELTIQSNLLKNMVAEYKIDEKYFDGVPFSSELMHKTREKEATPKETIVLPFDGENDKY